MLLFAALVLLILLSAVFSGSETALMAINRYRLRHLARIGHRGARRVETLLRQPDRLIGLVLLGNNFVNVLASSIATLIALRLWGESGIAIGAALLTVVLLIFGEVTPKTLAALHPERLAFVAGYYLSALMAVLLPLVLAVNFVSNGLLRLLGVRPDDARQDSLGREELRTLLFEAGHHFSPRHRGMLLRILDLESVVVEDVMLHRNEVRYLDLDDSWPDLIEQMRSTPHTRLPVCRGSLDQVLGILHLRRVMHLLADNAFDAQRLQTLLQEPYYVPEGTVLTQQLLQFQTGHERLALVVNEYGDTVGLITVEDILGEIIGEFSDTPTAVKTDVHPQADGSCLVAGSASVRELNRTMGWDLPLSDAKTLNGAILEHLEDIPTPATSLLLGNYPVEIVQTQGNVVRVARIGVKLKRSG
ncbi:MAG: HlyC/CorC family transporter [Gammaproteobacteria bacterium]